MTDSTSRSTGGFRRLSLIWRFARAYPFQLVAAGLALVVAAGATVAIPQGLKLVVDRGFGSTDPRTIAPYFRLMLGIVGVLGIATAVRFYFVSWIGERVVADVRRAVQSHLLTLDPSFFEENRPSEIASRLTSDTAVIEQVVGTTASVALRNLFVGIGGIGYMFLQSAKFTGMILLVIPVAVLPVVFLGRRVRGLSRRQPGQDRERRIERQRDAFRHAHRPGVHAGAARAAALRRRRRGGIRRRQAPDRDPCRADGDRPSSSSSARSSWASGNWRATSSKSR